MSATIKTRTILSLTCNTATQLAQTTVYASSVIIYADNLNTGNIYWGASNVASSNGIPLSKNQAQTINYELVYGTNGKIDLSTIYLDCDTTGNAARVNYIVWEGG